MAYDRNRSAYPTTRGQSEGIQVISNEDVVRSGSKDHCAGQDSGGLLASGLSASHPVHDAGAVEPSPTGGVGAGLNRLMSGAVETDGSWGLLLVPVIICLALAVYFSFVLS